jgi:hypothetical protein
MTPRREDARLIFCEDRLCSGRHPRVIPEGEPREARSLSGIHSVTPPTAPRLPQTLRNGFRIRMPPLRSAPGPE